MALQVPPWWTMKVKLSKFWYGDSCKMHFSFFWILEFYWEFWRKVDYKDTYNFPLCVSGVILASFLLTLDRFTPCSVSFIHFEQVNAFVVIFKKSAILFKIGRSLALFCYLTVLVTLSLFWYYTMFQCFTVNLEQVNASGASFFKYH